MSETEQEGGRENTAEELQQQQESTHDDLDQESKAAAEIQKEEEEDKGLIGEIMDMVRSGSPPDSEKKDEPTPSEAVANKGSASAENKEEKSAFDYEGDNADEKEAATEQATDETNDATEVDSKSDSKSDSKPDQKSEADDTNDPSQSATITTAAETEINREEESSPVPATADDSSPSKEEQTGETEDSIVTPHLLSDDEIIARGVAESDIEMYRKFYLNLMYSPKTWYNAVKNFSFTTEFITLTPEEIDALLAIHHSPNDDTTPEVSADVTNVLSQLQSKLDTAISKYEEGAFIKLNRHSIRDAVLDKCETDHVQAVEDGVLNELEIEQQFVNAYLNWRSWRSMSYRENSRTKLPSEQQRGNVVRRSFRRIRKSISGGSGRRSSTGDVEMNNAKKDDTPLAEESGKDKEESKEDEKKEESKDEEKKDGEEEKKDDDETKEETDQKEASAEGTVETTDGNEDSKESDKEEGKGEETAAADDIAVTIEATVEDTSADNEDQSKQEQSEEETGSKEDKKSDEDKKVSEIEEIKEEKVESKESPEGRGEEEQKERKVPPPLFGKEQQFVKVKAETRGNKILRAFIKATNAMYRITSGEQAIQLLSTSRVIKEDLEQAKVFANITGAEAVLSIQRWHADVAKYPGMQFRAFVYKNKLTAFSQKDDVAYIPNIVRYKDTIQTKVVHFYNSTIKKSFEDMENYVVDIFVGTSKIYVVDLYPFHTGTGACLFTWQQNRNVLLGAGSLGFRYIPTPFKNCYTGLHPHWQQVCTNIQQKKKREGQQSGKCLIL